MLNAFRTVLAASLLGVLIPAGSAETPSESAWVEAQATKPLLGGLGVTFGQKLPPDHVGAELALPPVPPAANVKLKETRLLPGQVNPWRLLLQPNLPRPFRKFSSEAFVMLNHDNLPLRAVSRIEYEGCGEEVAWLHNIIVKKYEVDRALPPFETGADSGRFRFLFSDKQIDVSCGEQLQIDYADYGAIRSWTERQRRLVAKDQRNRTEVERKAFILDNQRAMRFADEFTLGDRYRLSGGFGIAFDRAFAPNSSKEFPIDQTFIVVLPELPDAFKDGEIRMEISPAREPIVIRGKFTNLDFERVAHALRAKYGTPMKSTDRHVIHKVSGNHAILRRLPDGVVELAFIDTEAKAAQRARRWARESEGV